MSDRPSEIPAPSPTLRDQIANAIRSAPGHGLTVTSATDAAVSVIEAEMAVSETRTELRERIADAIRRYDWDTGISANPEIGKHQWGEADAVLPVVEAALAAIEQRAEKDFRQLAELYAGACKGASERAALAKRAEQAEAALRDLTDPRPCDPHPGNGYCQTHGETPPCPHAAAKKILDRTAETTPDPRLSELVARAADIDLPTSYTDILAALLRIGGDLARAYEPGQRADMERELGNLVVSALRWMVRYGLDPAECIETAEAAQRAYHTKETNR